MTVRPHVGTLGEKPLHASLKRWYSEEGDRVEVPVDGFVIDLVRGDTLIEIQTRGFASMKRKLVTLLDVHPVHLVHPIAVEKWIVKVDESGTEVSRRRSPKRGSAVDVFTELVAFPDLVAHPRLTMELLLVNEDEVRRFDATRAWRRKGWVVQERRLLEVLGSVPIETPDDLALLIPGALPDPFTTADLAAALHRNRRLAQQMTYCLRHTAAIHMVGKTGNAIRYSRTIAPE